MIRVLFAAALLLPVSAYADDEQAMLAVKALAMGEALSGDNERIDFIETAMEECGKAHPPSEVGEDWQAIYDCLSKSLADQPR